jgi:hypothetical protein
MPSQFSQEIDALGVFAENVHYERRVDCPIWERVFVTDVIVMYGVIPDNLAPE